MTPVFAMMLGSLPLFPMLGEPRAAIEAAYPDHREFNCMSNNPMQGFMAVPTKLGELPDYFETDQDLENTDEETFHIDIGFWGCDKDTRSSDWTLGIKKEKDEELLHWLISHFGPPTEIQNSRFGKFIDWRQDGFTLTLMYHDNGRVSLLESMDVLQPSAVHDDKTSDSRQESEPTEQEVLGQTCGLVPFWNDRKSVAEIRQLFESAGYQVAIHDRATIDEIPDALGPDHPIVEAATTRLLAYGVDELKGCSVLPVRITYFIYFSKAGEILGAYRMEKATQK